MPTINNATFAYVTNVGDGTVSVIDTANRTVIDTIHVGHLAPDAGDLAITPDGRFVYVTTADSAVAVIDRASHTVNATISVSRPASVRNVAIKPDGTHAYVTGALNDGTRTGIVTVIDTATNSVETTISIPNTPFLWGVAITPNGQRAYVTDAAGETISVIDTATNTVTSGVGTARHSLAIAITPDGNHGYFTSDDVPVVYVFDTATNTGSGSIQVGRVASESVAIIPNGSFAYATAEGNIYVIDTATNTVVGSPIPVGGHVHVAFTPDGRFAYATGPGNTVLVIDTTTRAVVGAAIPVGLNPRRVAITSRVIFRFITAGELTDGRTQAFTIDGGGQLYTRWETSTAPNPVWSAWSRFRTPPHGVASLGVGYQPDKKMQLFAIDRLGNPLSCWKSTVDPNAGWTAWSAFV